MKLRRITLTNLRQFTGRRASLSGIGDGITVLCEANEFGKSTFFDALHAVFFERHRSTRAPVKSLQPYAAGAPEVEVDIDLPQGRFTLAKRWLSRPMARVTDATGRIIAQDDEAEAWIDALSGGGLAGPSGLLWVRQGVLGMDPDNRRDSDRDLTTRRDLMAQVAGQIDAMTGGRRMNAVLDQVAAALAPLVTATGRPRVGGAWAAALDDAAALAARETDLRGRVAGLGQDLRRRSDLIRDQARLTDPATVQARDAALADAARAHQAALAHAAQQAEAARGVALADLTAEATAREVARLERLAERQAAATAALTAAAARADAARAHAGHLADRDRSLTEAATQAGDRTRALRLRLAAAQKAQVALAARQMAADLAGRLTQADALLRQQTDARAQRSLIKVTAQSLAMAQKLQTAVDRITAQSDAQAVTVRFSYSGPARAQHGGAPVPQDAPQRLDAPAVFDLPGFGALRVDPGAGPGGDLPARLTDAAAALTRHLALCGAPDLPAALRDLRAGERLDDAMRGREAALSAIAPDGVAALRDALARAEVDLRAASDPDTAEHPAAVEALLHSADAAEQTARDAAATAHAVATAAGEQRAQADADLKSGLRAQAQAADDAGDPAALALALAALRDRLPAQQTDARTARADVARLLAQAPDVATAAARLARAASVTDQARQQAITLREDLAGLNTRIEVLADQGIEETLNEVTTAAAAARTRAQRYEAEVLALTRLRQALDDARAQARDAYFGPVLQELTPLLAILHPDARLQIDDKTLLPAILTRAGQSEPLDVLSGGTREQLAILTRLAFARLFAKAGRQVPVILDDALVHSDDDRIEAMFTALHRVAVDQQILVLTCRQRAFAALGGDRARVTVTPV